MSALFQAARDGASLRDWDIVDLHGHLGRFNFGIPDLTTDGMVAAMDRLGIALTVCSHMRCMSADTGWGNDQILAAMQAHPGRILGYFSVWPDNAESVRQESLKRIGEGFTGFKAHNVNGFAYDDPAYAPAFELCAERGLPALLHTWGDPKEFAQVRNLAARHPELALLLAHAGCANEAGYIAIARECPHVYLDTAYSASPRGMIARLAREAGVDKIVWGSDSYFFSPAQQIGKVLGADLPDNDKHKILSLNGRRLLARVKKK
jgi:predicted TIM-barrel fold metal-dependent hydrolase